MREVGVGVGVVAVDVGVALVVDVGEGERDAVGVEDGVALGEDEGVAVLLGVELPPPGKQIPKRQVPDGEGLGLGQFEGDGLGEPLGDGHPCCAAAKRPNSTNPSRFKSNTNVAVKATTVAMNRSERCGAKDAVSMESFLSFL